MTRNYAIKQTNQLWWWSIIFAVVAAILYYSWPLGYWLNPHIFQHGLASDLGAKGQPYSWLFAALDVMSGALILLVALWLAHAWRRFTNVSIRLIIWGYGLFGVLTAVDALLPMNCLADEHRCSALINNPAIILHGIASIGSIGALTVSIVGIWQLLIVTNNGPLRLRWLLHAVMFTWFGFGLLTLGLILNSRSSGVAQHVFITVCSLITILVPYVLSHLHAQEVEFSNALAQKPPSDNNA